MVKAILVYPDGKTKEIELREFEGMGLPARINIPTLEGGHMTFERSGTATDGRPIYGHIS